MTRDRLDDAIAWAEVETEKAWEAAEYYAAKPMDYDGHCLAKAKALRETAQRYEILAKAARESTRPPEAEGH